MQTFLLISLGALTGANLRYLVGQLSGRFISSSLPVGTLLINVSGSLILGFFLVWTSERVLADPRWRLLIAVGFCGGYTTYSSYAYETFALFEQGQWLACAGNILLTNVLCLLGTAAGAALARLL
ncbi:MAG: fluoride efflux transporter CrcB [Acidobacteriaceae bacterium]|nr:fluoride efflux transporter CrcB [Acidobacteriaceae bacterium]